MIHDLPLSEDTVHGYFSSALPPVLTVDPGDSVRFQSLNAGWRWEPDAEHFERDSQLHSGHALSGPIEVRGARAGQTLVVGIDEVTPGSWGVTFGEGEPFHWTLDGGTAIDDRGYLPIPVDGALLSAGDGHGAQGDGEVSGTAIECPLERAQLTFTVRDDLELRMPVARTADAWVAFGFDEDLDLAAEQCLATMLDLMERELGVERKHALALASVAVDLHVTQIVNVTKGVHAVLRDGALGG